MSYVLTRRRTGKQERHRYDRVSILVRIMYIMEN